MVTQPAAAILLNVAERSVRSAVVVRDHAIPELTALADDIRVHGLREPIVLHPDGRVLDGRNRLAACFDAGVQARFVTYEGDDPVAFVVSLNLRRRHLNESQRAMVAARIANLGEGRPELTAPIGAVSHEAAGEMLNVGRRSIQRAAIVRDHAIPDLAAKVDAGQIAVSTAAEVARLPPLSRSRSSPAANARSSKRQRQSAPTVRKSDAPR